VFGLPERDSITAIHKEFGGTVEGRKPDLGWGDDQTNPTEAARRVTRLAADDKGVQHGANAARKEAKRAGQPAPTREEVAVRGCP